ncbi:MAG: septum formation initiator family protein [Lachnospiraceae bacterium]
MAKRRRAIRKKGSNRFSMTLVVIVICMLLLVVFIKSIELRETLQGTEERKALIKEQIVFEEERAIEIEEFRKYTNTKKYIEEIAKEKLGLVYEDEILFKTEE